MSNARNLANLLGTNTTIQTAKIADDAVTNAKILDGTIAAVNIADDAVTSAKILDGTIATANIADDAVTGAKIEDSPSIANGLTLSDGDLVMASGHGVSFAATSDATGMSSEIMDDYEEGVYTPTVAGATSGSYTVGDSATKLSYVKIGRMVHLQGQIHITGKSSPSGVVTVSLPFASGTNTDLSDRSVGSVVFDSASSGNGVAHNSGNFINFLISSDASVGQFRSSEENESAGSLNQSHLDTNDRFTIGITYSAH